MCGATRVKQLEGDQQPCVPHKSTGRMSWFQFSCVLTILSSNLYFCVCFLCFGFEFVVYVCYFLCCLTLGFVISFCVLIFIPEWLVFL